LLTRPTLELIDYPEVFAIGDIAEIRQSKTKIVPATAQAAYQQASFLAKNLQLALQARNLRHFHYLHLGDMLTLGKGAAVVSSFGVNLEGSIAAIVRRLIYVQRLPTFRHRWQVLKNLLFQYI
jgi:NADH dehydrogenase